MTAPTPPDYSGSSDSVPTGTTPANPLDVWHLGNYYGQPIAIGTVQPGGASHSINNGQDLVPGKTNPISNAGNIRYASAQDYITQMADLWAQATAGTKPENLAAMRQYVALQNSLYNAGAYGATSYDKIRWGQWQGTEGALTKAIESFADFSVGTSQPMTFSEWLDSHRLGGQDTGSIGPGGVSNDASGGGGGAASTISLADPNAIRETAQQAAQAALGHVLKPGQLDAFVNQFHAAQASYQTQAGGEAVSPDLTADANALVQQGDNAQEFSNHQALGYMDTFMNMFLPSGSQRGGVQPVTPVG